ncbi:transglycosylase SLT domain-containing protein [Streptomyces longwoodensis]|uniref:transglycosylase SLT domain-containing protein n=1 Tax=Streptomyces longwoodensis TaxID=68231 RepID=UPI0033CD1BC7
MPEIDVVGTVGVDVVPIAPNFHTNLKTMVLPAAARVGEDAGRRMGEEISRHIRVAIPDAINTGGRTARVAATRQGDDNAGAFARAFKSRLEVAFRSLPRPNVRLSTTGFDADLARVRARMETLANKRVGVDVDAATAFAELSAIDAELARLGAGATDIQVRADIASARAGIAEMQRAVNDLDEDDVNIRVRADTGSARAELMQLGVLLGAVAAIPIVPVAAAGIGAIASAAVAAGAGVGALALAAVPAIKSVTSAMQAKTAAENDSTRATNNGAAAGVKAAQQALQMAGAQQTLRNAHRQAATSIAQADRQVQDAERSLVDAKRAAKQAEDDLTQARKDAAQQQKDLNDQLLDGILAQRDASLRVKEAKEDLDKTLADPKASALERERAQLAYDEATRNADRQKQKQAELKKTVEDAAKAGISGNKNVQAAAQRVADAQRRVQDQTRAVADARRKAQEAQVQAAEQIASAERGVQAARLSSIDTTAKAVTKSDEYRKALAKLTPEQRALFESIAGPKGLKAAFSDWARSLSPDVIPLFTRAVNGAKGALPGLSPLVREAAKGIGELQDSASRELKKPFWADFLADLTGSVRPAVVGLGKAFGNTLKGMAGVVDAFLPRMDSIADRLVTSSGKFADWGTGLKGSPEFEKFLKYASDNGPRVAGFFAAIAGAALDIGSALSPLSGPILDGLTWVVNGIASIAENMPWLVRGIYLAVIAWKAWTVAVWLWDSALAASGIPLIIAGIVALAAAVVYAYQKFPWFRAAVQSTWAAIQTATDWLWTKSLKPFFDGFGAVVVWLWSKIIKPYIGFMVAYWTHVADVITWLWTGIFKPIFGFIGALIAYWWTNVVLRYFNHVVGILHTVGDAFAWLYKVGVKPHVDKISDIAQGLYKHGIKPAFDKIVEAAAQVGDAFKLAKDAVAKHWRQVAKIAAQPVNFILKWVYTNGLKAVVDKVGSFVGLDPLPAAPKLLDENPKFFANGGRTQGGIPGVDSIPILAMADEFIIKRSSARKIGFDKLAYMNETGEIPRFKDGGIVGDFWNGTKGVIKDVASGAIDVGSFLNHLLLRPDLEMAKLLKPTVDRIRVNLTGTPYLDTLGKVSSKLVKGIRDKITDAVSGGGGGGGGTGHFAGRIPTGQHAAIIRAAMAAAHVPPPGTVQQWMVGLNTLITRESNWVPNAINRWDSNAAAGHPSQGLAQTIPSTWSAFVPESLRSAGILDPVGNVAAAIRYIVSRYGNITNVAQANANKPPQGYALGGRVTPHWYDDGGYLPPGLSVVANGTGSPEPVFTSDQWATLRDSSRGRGFDADGINVYVSTTLDGRELTGHVDKRIELYDRAVATDLNNGRYV